MAPSTEERIKNRFPDLKWVKNPTVEQNPAFQYPGFSQTEIILQKGHVKSTGQRVFDHDVVLQPNQPILLRDGVTIYTDVFLPATQSSAKVPALLVWSPYGKTGTGVYQYGSAGPFHCGVPPSKVSGYQKFEGPDPAEWCPRGYAILNIDSRGSGVSGGNVHWWGIQEAEDINDTIEWASDQTWCDGTVAMIGNSWLAIAQINFASRLSHPALKALAPMEALNDPYRDIVARGGRPHHIAFNRVLASGFTGPGYTEDVPTMLELRPLYDDYWQSKYMDTSNIDVPLYLTASYSSGLHVAGSFNTYRTAKTAQKWLRVHPYQEWYDLYRPEVVDDLQAFFDRFCKNINNGWDKSTPPVRLSLLSFDGSTASTIIERAEHEYPLARQKLVTYFLDAKDQSLKAEACTNVFETSYEAHHMTESSDFVLTFSEYTEIAGYAKVVVWMSCEESDDMDVTVHLRKVDHKGKLLEHLNYPCPVPVDEVPNTNVAKVLGPEGFLRASHAISQDQARSRGNGQEVFYAHDRCEKIPPGTKVRLEITLWPMGMVFDKGESIMLRIAGHEMIHPEFEFIKPTEPEDRNIGRHVIHTGGRYDSVLILPII